MIGIALRLFGLVLLAGGAVLGVLGLSELGQAGNGAQMLQARGDLVDAALLLGGGLMCLGMAAMLSGKAAREAEGAHDPYDDHPKMAREVSNAMRAPELYDGP